VVVITVVHIGQSGEAAGETPAHGVSADQAVLAVNRRIRPSPPPRSTSTRDQLRGAHDPALVHDDPSVQLGNVHLLLVVLG
jgi:hypothetical protein